jgi:polysaccharide biosynthesis protein PslA
MSRIGPSVRAATFGSTATSFGPAETHGQRPPIDPVATTVMAIALDVLVCVTVPALATFLRGHAPAPLLLSRIAFLAAVLTVAFTASSGGYGSGILFRRRPQFVAVLRGAVLALAVVALAVGILVEHPDVDPLWCALAAVSLVAGLLLGRTALVAAVTHHPAQRFAPRAVIVGSDLSRVRLGRLLQELGQRPLRVIGFVDDRVDPVTVEINDVPFLGAFEELLAVVRRGMVDEVILALPWSEEVRIMDLLDHLSNYPVHVRLAPDLIGYRFPRRIGGERSATRLLHLVDRPMSGWDGVIKRAEDLLIGGTMLAMCAVPMGLIAIALKLDSPGPILFRQKRTGFNNRDFEMLKFRTMFDHLTEHQVRHQAVRNDPRVTRVGAFLRRTSLDELPQIFNVLCGDMSVVGPRPHARDTPAGDRTFEQVVERYAARHRVRPGLTGLAQVRGLRGETPTEDRIVKRVESDLEYIERWSIWLDFVILMRTAVIVLRMQNAY